MTKIEEKIIFWKISKTDEISYFNRRGHKRMTDGRLLTKEGNQTQKKSNKSKKT